MKDKTYSFNTDQVAYEIVETKSGKDYFVMGYISTSERDLVDDIVSVKAMESMLKQIKNSTITLDYEHEAFRDDITILPVGKIVDAKVDDRGLWVKCKLNRASPKFKNLWGSVKEGFVNSFSIAFSGVKSVSKKIGEDVIRVIEDLKLLNVALTGIPVNQGATMTGYGMKSVMLKALSDLENNGEVNKMTEEIKEKIVAPEIKSEDKPKEEVKEVKEEPKEEAKKVAEEKSMVQELKAQVDELNKKLEANEKSLKKLQDKEVFKAEEKGQAPIPVVEEKDFSILNRC